MCACDYARAQGSNSFLSAFYFILFLLSKPPPSLSFGHGCTSLLWVLHSLVGAVRARIVLHHTLPPPSLPFSHGFTALLRVPHSLVLVRVRSSSCSYGGAPYPPPLPFGHVLHLFVAMRTLSRWSVRMRLYRALKSIYTSSFRAPLTLYSLSQTLVAHLKPLKDRGGTVWEVNHTENTGDNNIFHIQQIENRNVQNPHYLHEDDLDRVNQNEDGNFVGLSADGTPEYVVLQYVVRVYFHYLGPRQLSSSISTTTIRFLSRLYKRFLLLL